MGIISAAVNYNTPSTNDINRTNGWAHVDQTSVGVGQITLNLVQPRNFYACFEYRTDGDTTQRLTTNGGNNWNSAITDGLYPYKCLSTISSFSITLHPSEYVEVREVFGGERDERFDWTRFDVLQNPDLDGDSILNEADFCPNTTNDAPSVELGVNRNIWRNNGWTTLLPKGKVKSEGPSAFNMTMTHGCSCNQILNLLKDEGLGEFGGHYKFGCSKSVLEDFTKDISDGVLDGRYLVDTVTVPAGSSVSTLSNETLLNGVNYILKASGTWTNSNNVSDAEYISKNAWATYLDGYDIAPYFLGEGAFDLQVNGAFINWGAYSTTHNYEYSYTGTGDKVNFLIFDGDSNTSTIDPSWYGDNSGSLTVKIYGQI